MTERQRMISDNFRRVSENVEKARERRVSLYGADAAQREVRLLAATKTVPLEDILFLVNEFGLSLCGENRQNEFTEKHEAVQAAGAQMHFIGHLQTNKLRHIVGRTELIHSVDSLRLASEISRRSLDLGIRTNILVEVNIGEEEAKTGLLPCDVAPLLDEIRTLAGLNLQGMMAMAPKCDDIGKIREYFRKSYRIFLDFFAKNTHNIEEPILSMGMSDSYETAIEEGATLVRVGSAIFGERIYQ